MQNKENRENKDPATAFTHKDIYFNINSITNILNFIKK